MASNSEQLEPAAEQALQFQVVFMCGICGVLSFDGDPSRVAVPRLRAMSDTLAHRGPDGEGVYVDARTPGVGLAHRRLSIIDPAGGGQPLGNEDGTIQVVFNGEIFNYVELRRELSARGHQLRTQTDTEVLVHLYEEVGDEFVHHLNGQFAIALWDARRRRLVLARDRPGILPLYYHERAGELLFGSEIKAILAGLPEPPRANADALRDVMTLWSPLCPATLFEGIVEVEPGQMVVVEDGRITARTYWSWRLAPADEAIDGEVGETADALVALLADATRLRMRADVDVGALLSGGLDSSILVGLAARQAGSAPRTFSVGFSDPSLDESGYQRLMANAVSSPHRHVNCAARDIGDRFPGVIRATEMPLTRTGPAVMHQLAAEVRASGCKVVLTGEGADEVFGGYDLFKEAKVRAFCARQPGSPRRLQLLRRLYPSFGFTRRQPVGLLAAAFVGPRDNPDDPGYSHQARWAAGPAVEHLLAPALLERCSAATPAERTLDRLGPALAGLPLFERAQLLESRTLLPGYLLSSQSDRMFMAHAVEGRFPYLDHRVIEFANRLSPRLKMRALKEKVLLKHAAQGLVPDPILKRPKQPYRGPDASVFLGPHRPAYVGDLLAPEALAASGYFDPLRVAHLRRRLETAATDGRPVSHRDSLAFLTVLSTEIWHAQFQTRRSWS